MNRKPPVPVCRAFLVCREIVEDPQRGDFILVGQAQAYVNCAFPAAAHLGFFIGLTSTHGQYLIEIQLQNAQGEVVWREMLPEPCDFPDPLALYDLGLKNVCPVFPGDGDYAFVLVANGEELSRQRFVVRLVPEPVGR